MADFLPFCAVHYNQEKFPKVNDLVSPPYDMVGEDLKNKLMKEYYNYVHLTMPTVEDITNYKTSTHSLFGWLMRDVLVVDKIPSFYVHEKQVSFGGIDYRRYGVIGLLKIEEYGNVVKKAEQTDDKYITDRYLLQKETQSNLEPVFAMVKDRENFINTRVKDMIRNVRPILELTDMTGDLNRIYKIEDIEFSKEMHSFYSDKAVYIVDGQHRYEAAVKYKEEMKQSLGEKYSGREPFNFIMMDLFNMYDESTRVFPVNRLVKNTARPAAELVRELDKAFKIAAIAFTDIRMEKLARDKLRSVLNENRKKNLRSIGLYMKDIPNRYLVLTVKDEKNISMMDPELVEKLILTPVLGIPQEKYETDVYCRSDYGSNYNGALDLVRSGEYAMAFILNLMDVDTVVNMADAKKWLPKKSVNFYPKVFSGLTLYSYRYSTYKLY